MKLSDILEESCINMDMESLDKEESFEELVSLLAKAGKISDRKEIIEGLKEREKLGTTGIGEGVAIPHAKFGSVKKLTAALGISKVGIDYDAVDDEPVHVVILVLAEVNNPGPHIRLLAEIARLFQVPGFRDKLCNATSAREALELIKSEEN